MDALHHLFDQVGATWSLWLAALQLDPDVATVLAPGSSWFPVIAIAIGAAVATLVGQSVVLFVNRVRSWALAFSLAFAIAGILGSHLVEGLLLWALGNLLVAQAWTVWQIVKVVILSSSPLLFGFLTAIPLLGPAINRLLSVWSLVVLWAVVGLMFRSGPWATAALALVAWLGMLLLGNLLGPVLAEVRDRLWRRVTGRPLHLDTNFLLELADGPDEGKT